MYTKKRGEKEIDEPQKIRELLDKFGITAERNEKERKKRVQLTLRKSDRARELSRRITRRCPASAVIAFCKKTFA